MSECSTIREKEDSQFNFYAYICEYFISLTNFTMKRLITAFCLILSLSVLAQNKLDPEARRFVESAAPTDSIGAIVEFNDQNDSFGSLDIDIVSRIGNMATVNVTAAQMEEIAALPNVIAVSVGFEKKHLTTSPKIQPSPLVKRRYVAPPSPGIFGGLRK